VGASSAVRRPLCEQYKPRRPVVARRVRACRFMSLCMLPPIATRAKSARTPDGCVSIFLLPPQADGGCLFVACCCVSEREGRGCEGSGVVDGVPGPWMRSAMGCGCALWCSWLYCHECTLFLSSFVVVIFHCCVCLSVVLRPICLPLNGRCV